MTEPTITTRAANDDGASNLPINHITVHATCGGRGYPHESEAGVAKNTAVYFKKKTTQASAHYVEDIDSEEHCVPEDVIAWHAPPNKHSIGIEICGEASYTREQWLSPEVWPAVQRAAARLKDIAARHNVPLVKLSAADLVAGKRGYCGHVDVSQAFHQTTHTDPGPNFPWDRFAELLGVTPSPAPAPRPVPTPSPIGPSRPTPRSLPAWPLTGKNYFGLLTGPALSHGGWFGWEQPYIRLLQQWLIFHGVTSVDPAHCLSSTWADGKFEKETAAAVVLWHQRFYPNQPSMDRIYADDAARLGRP